MDQQLVTTQGEPAVPGAFSGRSGLLPPAGLAEGAAPWHPVDELAQVQAELDRLLRRRETLVGMFLTPGADCQFEGQTHVVEVVAENRRTFDRRRLPAAILQDDRLYAVLTCRTVKLVPKQPDPEDTAVIEPFH